MATTPSHGYGPPTGRSTNQRSRRPQQPAQQTKKSILRDPARGALTNKSKDIQIRLGQQHPHKGSMNYHSSSFSRRRRFDDLDIDPFTDPLYAWDQPSNLQEVPFRTMSSPVRTPPRLRALMSSPGLKIYHNTLNLRRPYSPLPGIDLNEHPMSLDSWGISPHEYRAHPNFALSRPLPSPLTRYGLHSNINRQKKSYIVVPSLTNLISPRVVPDPHYSIGLSSNPTYIPRIHSFTGPDYNNNLSDFVQDHPNNAYSKLTGESGYGNRNQTKRTNKKQLDRHYEDLHRRMNELPANDDHLFSDDWLHEVENQRRADISPSRAQHRSRYHDLPVDAQARLLADINQELIDYEVGSVARELSDQLFEERMARIRKLTDPQGATGRTHRGPNRFDQRQTQAIDEAVDSKLLDALHLNNLIAKYLRQRGSKVDVTELSRLLDGTILDSLVNQYQTVEEHRTLDNYASKKFHMNTFMNAAMDLLLTELSASLIEDMKDLDEQQRKFY